MAARRFKYHREDFGPLPARLEHLTIYVNFLDDHVEARNTLVMTALTRLERLPLDANGLKIIAVDWLSDEPAGGEEALPLAYDYEEDRNRLVMHLPRVVEAGTKFRVRTETHCFPSDHVLEGIYKDMTPAGAPQQYMSQCQQWGFQRIMPILDDCRAKCTMTTTIEADARYTHCISNGNISRRANPAGRPVPKPGDPTRQLITYENSIPMAPYLFLACVGTWDALVDEVTYPGGGTVRLEYLVPPGQTEGARIPMEILKESVLWVGRTQDYLYTGDTYRTICMNKSNFGGMENVGNTTIVTDAALIGAHTLDATLLYAHAVIVHEFEHNQCGSETTMETPFDMWLNEAYTVDVERQFSAALFDPAFIRLTQVDSIRHPLLGPLAIEDGGHVGRIVRDGFNDPDELVDSVTYVKAAEVIRMLRLILGPEAFHAGKTLYFSRYRHGNANSDQFFACFEEVAGRSLEQFKSRWLHTIGYPRVVAHTHYDPVECSFRLRFEQRLEPGEEPFHLPIALALVDRNGRDIPGTECVFELDRSSAELTLDGLPEAPAFASIHRDYSFYGTFNDATATFDSLAAQALLDANGYNRVDAMRQLTDRERLKLLHDPAASPDPRWLEVYGEILAHGSLPPALKGYLLRIDEQPMDRRYGTWYAELVDARERLMLAVNQAYRAQLEAQFEALNAASRAPAVGPRAGIEERLLKHVLLDLVVIDDAPASQQLILSHLRTAATAQDRVAALLALNRSSARERRELLEETYRAWHGHLSGYANYLRVVASGTRPDVFAMIETEKRRPSFDITQPTWARALFLPMAVNLKMVWSDAGIAWVAATVCELAPINATTASRLLNVFQHVRLLRPAMQRKVIEALRTIQAEVSDKASPTIHGQATAYLEGV
jgi:aminopeptidase N